MEDILKFKIVNQLRSVYRATQVPGRKESSAEHTWSCLLLADYFLTQSEYQLDRVRVYELIMYHDLVEVEAGDVELHPDHETPNKALMELSAAKSLRNKLPQTINDKFWSYFLEFEEQKTLEAKFARAIDALDPLVQQVAFKVRFEGWSKDFLIKKKAKYFEPFPDMQTSFNELLDFFENNEYFER